MKFTNYLTEIKGVEIYPIISLLMFVVFFAIVTIWVMRWDNKTVEKMGNIPLSDNIEKDEK